MLRAHATFRPHDAPPATLLSVVVHALRSATPIVSAPAASAAASDFAAAVEFVCALCAALHLVAPRPAPYFLTSLLALLHHALAAHSAVASVRQQLTRAYDALIANTTHAGLNLALTLVRLELASHEAQRYAVVYRRSPLMRVT